MKKNLLFILAIYPVFVFAQSTNPNGPEISLSYNTVEPFVPLGNTHFVDEKWLDGGDYTNRSFAIGLTGKYFFNQRDGIRLRMIYTKRNVTDHRDMTTGAHEITDEKFRQTLFKISPGFQWTFVKNKISFFGGFELPVTVIGKMTHHEYVLYETLDGVTRDEYNILYDIPGGFSAGLGIYLGSNYFITNRFAIGFDFSTAYQYTSVGGTLTYTTVVTGTDGSSTVVYDHEETIKKFGFLPVQAAINLTFKFGQKKSRISSCNTFEK